MAAPQEEYMAVEVVVTVELATLVAQEESLVVKVATAAFLGVTVATDPRGRNSHHSCSLNIVQAWRMNTGLQRWLGLINHRSCGPDSSLS